MTAAAPRLLSPARTDLVHLLFSSVVEWVSDEPATFAEVVGSVVPNRTAVNGNVGVVPELQINDDGQGEDQR